MTAEGRMGGCEFLGPQAFDGATDGPVRPPAAEGEANLFAGAPGGASPAMENMGE